MHSSFKRGGEKKRRSPGRSPLRSGGSKSIRCRLTVRKKNRNWDEEKFMARTSIFWEAHGSCDWDSHRRKGLNRESWKGGKIFVPKKKKKTPHKKPNRSPTKKTKKSREILDFRKKKNNEFRCGSLKNRKSLRIQRKAKVRKG